MDDRFHPGEQSGLNILSSQQQNEGASEPLFEVFFQFVVERAEAQNTLDKPAEQRDGDRADDPEGHLSNRFLYPAAWKGWDSRERRAIAKLAKGFRPDWRLVLAPVSLTWSIICMRCGP